MCWGVYRLLRHILKQPFKYKGFYLCFPFQIFQVKCENGTQYLTAVCMGCLEGVSPDRVIRCRFVKLSFTPLGRFLVNFLFFFRFCSQKWDGSSLVLGTMYSYDIFAAMPCCTERLKVSLFFNSYIFSPTDVALKLPNPHISL